MNYDKLQRSNAAELRRIYVIFAIILIELGCVQVSDPVWRAGVLEMGSFVQREIKTRIVFAPVDWMKRCQNFAGHPGSWIQASWSYGFEAVR